MTTVVDPYRVLGLEPGASQAEVKRAYRRLAKTLHPDAAGERALPAFLAVQGAYERLTGTKVRTVRPTGGVPGTGAGGSGPREPWRADPARARAAREQARRRRGWAGGPADRQDPSASGNGGPESGSRASATGAGARPGTRAGSGSRDGSKRAGGDRTGGRRRPTRTATLGSTSYDEARDPADRRWSGASWYGPTTGEYWHINPREYADPRKHGPAYVRRGQGGAEPDPMPGPDEAGEPAPGAAPPAESVRPAGTTTGRAGWQPPRPRSGSGGGIDGRLGSIGRAAFDDPPGPIDPLRRLLPVLVAWPPLGLVAAAAIGNATGCASQSVACDGADRLLPWLAQALLLGVLLLVPRLARALAAGTIALLMAILPGAAVITVLGGAGTVEGPPVLGAWLVVAWAVGVGWAVARLARGPRPRGLAP